MSTTATDLKSRLHDSIPQVNVRNHLKVLGVFFYLLESVPKDQASDDKVLDEFFQRSTYRLQLWVERIIKDGDDERLLLRDYEQLPLRNDELPPLDVALALHSLMLSPYRYFEDSELRFKQLKRMREYPLDMMVDALNANNDGYDELKCQPASEHWNRRTGLKFDAINSMKTDPMRSVICPTCESGAEVPWKGDYGFAGPYFQHQCSECQTSLTHDTLCAGKFFQALSRASSDPGFCLPNTAILVKGELDVKRCPAITDAVRKCFENQDGSLFTLKDTMALARAGRCSSIMEYIAKSLSRQDGALRAESVPILLRAFNHSHPFTQDVVDVIRHQHPLIRWVYDEGWLWSNSGGPSSDDLDLAYAQYDGLLGHIRERQRRQPGWKDDIVWHTHQLMPKKYRVDLVGYTGVFVDHLTRGEVSANDQHKEKPPKKDTSKDQPSNKESHSGMTIESTTEVCHSGINRFPFLKTESVSDNHSD